MTPERSRRLLLGGDVRHVQGSDVPLRVALAQDDRGNGANLGSVRAGVRRKDVDVGDRRFRTQQPEAACLDAQFCVLKAAGECYFVNARHLGAVLEEIAVTIHVADIFAVELRLGLNVAGAPGKFHQGEHEVGRPPSFVFRRIHAGKYATSIGFRITSISPRRHSGHGEFNEGCHHEEAFRPTRDLLSA